VAATSDMEIFVAVVDRGSLSSAAGALGITRSGVCRRVEQLERRLGVRLLNRTTRHLSLTEPGHVYLQHSRQALAEIDRAEQAAMAFQQDPRGVLKLVSPVMIGLHSILPLMREFLTTYPDLALNVVLTDDPNHPVQESDVIIAFGAQPDSSLIAHKLAESQRVICAAHNCLLLSGMGSLTNEWTFRRDGQVFGVKVTGNFVANTGDANYEALIAGIGIGRATDLRVGNDVAAGRLVRLLEEFEPDTPTPIYALHHSREQVPPKVRSFIDFCRGKLSKRPITAVAA
jgi:DNA-binding transcriptional LysR family regulator